MRPDGAGRWRRRWCRRQRRRRWCRRQWWWCRRRQRKTSVSLLWARFWGWVEMMDLRRHTKYFGNIWLLFGILFSVCVFVGIPKRDKYLAFYLCYKKNTHTQMKNGHFVMCISVSVQRNHLFCRGQIHLGSNGSVPSDLGSDPGPGTKTLEPIPF